MPDVDFTEVFSAHHGEMLRLAYLLAGDRTRAEDAVSEAFIKMYRRWQAGGIDNPRAYLRRAVVNEVNSRFRRLVLERREAAKRSGDDRRVSTPDEQIVDAAVVAAALRRLPERQRTAVVLRYYSDLPEAEVARIMGISVGTVKSTVSRGLAAMRRAMEVEAAAA